MMTPFIDERIRELHEELDALELEALDIPVLSREYLMQLRTIGRVKRRIYTLERQRAALREAMPQRIEESGVHPLLVGVPEPYGWGRKCEVVQ